MRRFRNRPKHNLKNKKFKKAFDDEDNKSFSLNTLAKLAQAFDKKLKVGELFGHVFHKGLVIAGNE